MSKFYSIKVNCTAEYEIKKSRYYSLLFHVDNENNVCEYIDEIKSKYKDATHICYAYILLNPQREKCSDDGEPTGTAGIPMLNLLKQNSLTNILAITVRYFGGIKLGVGGLSRSYANSLKSVLERSQINEITGMFKCKMVVDYNLSTRVLNKMKTLDYLNDIQVEYKDFATINFNINCDYAKEFLELIKNVYNIECQIDFNNKIYI